MKSLLTILALAGIVPLAACTPESHVAQSDLVGTYGVDVKNDGHLIPFVKVQQDRGALVIFEYTHGQWKRPVKLWGDDPTRPEPVTPFTKADLEKLVKHPVSVAPTGVQTEEIALVHVPPGWSDDGKPSAFTSAEGYFAVSLLGPMDLHRMPDGGGQP